MDQSFVSAHELAQDERPGSEMCKIANTPPYGYSWDHRGYKRDDHLLPDHGLGRNEPRPNFVAALAIRLSGIFLAYSCTTISGHVVLVSYAVVPDAISGSAAKCLGDNNSLVGVHLQLPEPSGTKSVAISRIRHEGRLPYLTIHAPMYDC